jgi:hypothetical protein
MRVRNVFLIMTLAISYGGVFAACPPHMLFCQNLPDRTSKDSAIFVGVVTRVVDPTPNMPLPDNAGQQTSTNPAGRMRAGDFADISQKRYPVVTFQVSETYLGPEANEFQVFLTSDTFLAGIPQQVTQFNKGEVWLVEAYYDPHERHWMTGLCERNKRADQAVEDLEILRNWKNGKRLPGRIFGQVANPTEGRFLPNATVYLQNDGHIVATTVTNQSGRFTFENVKPGVYAVATERSTTSKIDLRYAWCTQVALIVTSPSR